MDTTHSTLRKRPSPLGAVLVGTTAVLVQTATASASTHTLYATHVHREVPSAWRDIDQALGDPGCNPCVCDENPESYAWNGEASAGRNPFACLDEFEPGEDDPIGWDTTILTADDFQRLDLAPNETIKSVRIDTQCRYNYNETGEPRGGKLRMVATLTNTGATTHRDSPYFENTSSNANCRYRMQASGDITDLHPSGTWTVQDINQHLEVGVRRFDDGPCRSRLRVNAIRVVVETAVCGDGIVEGQEQCEGGPCCDAACRLRGPDQVCRPAAGECDLSEYCTGTASACPEDKKSPDLTTCTDDANPCTADYCLAGRCEHPSAPKNGTPCDDGQYCSVGETCVNGSCGNGLPRSCGPELECGLWTCDETTDQCVLMVDPDGTPCADEGEVCTDDYCVAGTCTHVEDPACRTAVLDIEPGCCPNPVYESGGGIVRVVIVGTRDLDVRQVDLTSLQLKRTDDPTGNFVVPQSRPAPMVVDVATPFERGDDCACHHLEGDRVPDLSLKFAEWAIIDSLGLSDLENRDQVELTLWGRLNDGTPFSASDCVEFRTGRRPNCPCNKR